MRMRLPTICFSHSVTKGQKSNSSQRSQTRHEIRTKINQESIITWEKFYNSISLETDPKKSWRKITNFLKPKGPRNYPTLN